MISRKLTRRSRSYFFTKSFKKQLKTDALKSIWADFNLETEEGPVSTVGLIQYFTNPNGFYEIHGKPPAMIHPEFRIL